MTDFGAIAISGEAIRQAKLRWPGYRVVPARDACPCCGSEDGAAEETRQYLWDEELTKRACKLAVVLYTHGYNLSGLSIDGLGIFENLG